MSRQKTFKGSEKNMKYHDHDETKKDLAAKGKIIANYDYDSAFDIHKNHKSNKFTDSYNVDCKCPKCIDIAWDKQCINCNLLQRDCYGQEHGEGEDIFNYTI